MDRRNGPPVQEEIEKLRPALQELTRHTRRPDSLSGDALLKKLPNKRPFLRMPLTARQVSTAALCIAAMLLLVVFPVRLLTPQQPESAGEAAPASLMQQPLEEAAQEDGLMQSAQAADAGLAAAADVAPQASAGVLQSAPQPDQGTLPAGLFIPQSYEEIYSLLPSSQQGSAPRAALRSLRSDGSGRIAEDSPRMQIHGDYLYTLSEPQDDAGVQIIGKESLAHVSSIAVKDATASSFYVYEDTLALVTTEQDVLTGTKTPSASASVRLYDITDKAAPRLEHTFTQQGAAVLSAAQGETLVLVSHLTSDESLWRVSDGGQAAKEDGAGLVPRVADSAQDGERVLAPADLLVSYGGRSAAWAVVSAISLSQRQLPAHTRALLGGAEQARFSGGRLFLTQTVYGDASSAETPLTPSGYPLQGAQTAVYSLAADGDGIEVSAKGRVSGVVDSADALYCSGGVLFAAYTDYADAASPVGGLAALDEALSVSSSVTMPREWGRMTGARYAAQTAYLLTEQGGQAAAVDLTRPDALRVAGEAELGGYSPVWVPLPGNQAFILGENVTKAEDGLSIPTGLRLAWMDLSGAGAVRALDEISFGGGASTSAAVYDKSALVAAGTQGESPPCLGFPVQLYENGGDAPDFEGFVLYRAVDGKLLQILRQPVSGYQCAALSQDTLYIAADGKIQAFALPA